MAEQASSSDDSQLRSGCSLRREVTVRIVVKRAVWVVRLGAQEDRGVERERSQGRVCRRDEVVECSDSHAVTEMFVEGGVLYESRGRVRTYTLPDCG